MWSSIKTLDVGDIQCQYANTRFGIVKKVLVPQYPSEHKALFIVIISPNTYMMMFIEKMLVL